MQAISKLRVGTITTNYNNGKWFGEALASLVGQTIKPDYIVVVDDASTDNSWELITLAVAQYTKTTPESDQTYIKKSYNGTDFILVRRDKNGGPAAGRNTAIQQIKELVDVVAICDADDIYYPTKIEKSLSIMLAYPHVCLVYSDYDIMNVKTRQKKREYKESYNYDRLVEECIVSNNSVMSMSILNKVGMYDETLRGPEDYDMWLRIGEAAAVYHIPETLYMYRVTGDNITITTPSQDFARQVRRVHQKIMERRQNG